MSDREYPLPPATFEFLVLSQKTQAEDGQRFAQPSRKCKSLFTRIPEIEFSGLPAWN